MFRSSLFLKLRTRLFLNVVPFVVILVAIGVYAVVLLSSLTATVDVTGNYRSVTAVHRMQITVAKMEEGVRTAMDGDVAFGAKIFEQNRKEFEENLAQQVRSAKSPPAGGLNRLLNSNYLAFAAACTNLLAPGQPADQRLVFQQTIYPRLQTIDRLLDEILQTDQDAVIEATQNVEKIPRKVTRLMLLGIGAALILACSAWYKLARSILQPVQLLTRALHDLGEGHFDQLVPVTSQDELGDLAGSFNKMAAQLKASQQNTAEQIVRLHKTMEAALASFPDPVYVLNRTGGIELMNLAAAELTKELKLQNGLPAHLKETVQKALAGGENFLPHSFKEVMNIRLNGQEKSYLPRVLAMRNEENAPVGVAVALYDVTRFRLLDDAKTNLVSTVSHEIRTPLTSVRVVLHLLLEKTLGPLNPRQGELLEAARDESERLLRILNDLLDLTRLEQGNSDLYKEKTLPSELVQTASDIMRDSIATRGLKLVCKTDPDLPAVLVDRQRINHVFTNLINNAIKYSPPGGEITLHAGRESDREVQFTVTDEGPGVPEDYHDRIFDRFFRVPGQTKSGAGLGLSIACEILVAHGGRISVKNGAKRGSEFYFVLPGVDGEAGE